MFPGCSLCFPTRGCGAGNGRRSSVCAPFRWVPHGVAVKANIKINNEIFTVSVQKMTMFLRFCRATGAAVHVGASFMTPGWRRSRWRRCARGFAAVVGGAPRCGGVLLRGFAAVWRATQVSPLRWAFSVVGAVFPLRRGDMKKRRRLLSGLPAFWCCAVRGSDEFDAAFEELVEGFAFEQSVLQEGDVDELVHHGLPGAVVGEHFGLLLFLGGDVVVAL